MTCVKNTLLAFGTDPKQGINGKVGGINLLHTWTQQMTFHPHVHSIVPAGGLNSKKQWVHSKSRGDFLFPVKAMSRLFRGKLLAGIHQLFKEGKLTLTPKLRAEYKHMKNKLYQKEWVVYSKKAFGGPAQVLEYLGRYTHKICISNYRILTISKTHIKFRYLDRKAGLSRVKRLPGDRFLRLFAEHILPFRFIKTRYFGFLAPR